MPLHALFMSIESEWETFRCDVSVSGCENSASDYLDFDAGVLEASLHAGRQTVVGDDTVDL